MLWYSFPTPSQNTRLTGLPAEPEAENNQKIAADLSLRDVTFLYHETFFLLARAAVRKNKHICR